MYQVLISETYEREFAVENAATPEDAKQRALEEARVSGWEKPQVVACREVRE